MKAEERQAQARRDSAAIRGEPKPQEPLQPKGAQGQAQINYSKKATDVCTVANLKVTYREREDNDKRRRYYIGFVQFAYASFERGYWLVFLTNGKEEAGLKGVSFTDEKDMHIYLQKELAG